MQKLSTHNPPTNPHPQTTALHLHSLPVFTADQKGGRGRLTDSFRTELPLFRRDYTSRLEYKKQTKRLAARHLVASQASSPRNNKQGGARTLNNTEAVNDVMWCRCEVHHQRLLPKVLINTSHIQPPDRCYLTHFPDRVGGSKLA